MRFLSLADPAFLGLQRLLFILDQLSTPSSAVYSLRRLTSAYAGPAIRVRRSFDNAEANIGFTASGDLDTVALLAHVEHGGPGPGNQNGFVSTWYDQSGNGRNATQATAGEQPRIVASGAVITMNGRPVVSFDGNDILLTPSFMLGNTVVTVARRSTRFECVVEGANVGSADRGLWGLRASTTDFTTHFNYGINGSLLNATNADGFPMNVPQVVSQTVAKGLVATNASPWGIGGGSNGYVRLNGFISEMVATSALLSTTERQLIESNQGQYYGISFLALDQISTPAAAAYSLRKLRTAYTGNAIRVRRSSDNTEADIGFTATGELNTATLLAFVGTGNGFVTTWYDQSGNGRNAAQTTAGAQPRIVSNGAIETQNGRPTVAQSLGNQSLPISATFTGLTSATGTFVFRQITGNSGAHDFRFQAGGVNNHSPFSDGRAYDSFFSSSRQVFNNYGPVSIPSTTTLTVHTARQTGTALQVFKNGTQIDGDKTVSFQAPDGRSLFSPSFTGTVAVSEAIVFGTALSTTERQTIESNQGQFYGI
jgi:hypothetical protein